MQLRVIGVTHGESSLCSCSIRVRGFANIALNFGELMPATCQPVLPKSLVCRLPVMANPANSIIMAAGHSLHR